VDRDVVKGSGNLGRGFGRALLIALLFGSGTAAVAGEPAWTGTVVKRGSERAKIRSIPIEQRPNRPLHFYGNTVRRKHYRGSAVPLPRDVVNGTKAIVGSR
jgi:hypothetical protein